MISTNHILEALSGSACPQKWSSQTFLIRQAWVTLLSTSYLLLYSSVPLKVVPTVLLQSVLYHNYVYLCLYHTLFGSGARFTGKPLNWWFAFTHTHTTHHTHTLTSLCGRGRFWRCIFSLFNSRSKGLRMFIFLHPMGGGELGGHPPGVASEEQIQWKSNT